MQKRYRIRFGHMRRVGLIEGRIKKVVRQSKPQEITNILWAYATLQLPLEEEVAKGKTTVESAGLREAMVEYLRAAVSALPGGIREGLGTV